MKKKQRKSRDNRKQVPIQNKNQQATAHPYDGLGLTIQVKLSTLTAGCYGGAFKSIEGAWIKVGGQL